MATATGQGASGSSGSSGSDSESDDDIFEDPARDRKFDSMVTGAAQLDGSGKRRRDVICIICAAILLEVGTVTTNLTTQLIALGDGEASLSCRVAVVLQVQRWIYR